METSFLLFLALLVETAQLVSAPTLRRLRRARVKLFLVAPPPPRPHSFSHQEGLTLVIPDGNPHPGRAPLAVHLSVHGSLVVRGTLENPSVISLYIFLCVF